MWVFFTQLRYQDEFVRFVLVPPFWALAISERRYELQFSADIYVIVLDPILISLLYNCTGS